MTSQFGTRLRQLRQQAGMTPEQLAERAGLGVRTIRRLESGERGDPMALLRWARTGPRPPRAARQLSIEPLPHSHGLRAPPRVLAKLPQQA